MEAGRKRAWQSRSGMSTRTKSSGFNLRPNLNQKTGMWESEKEIGTGPTSFPSGKYRHDEISLNQKTGQWEAQKKSHNLRDFHD